MRSIAQFIWDAWNSGNGFVGDDLAPNAVVRASSKWGSGSLYFPGVSWLSDVDDEPTSPTFRQALPPPTPIPNVLSIQTDQSLNQDAATCTIVLGNWAKAANPGIMGTKGYLSPTLASERDRWGQPNLSSPVTSQPYSSLLHPNSRIETWQGYGGRNKSFAQAVNDGNLYITGYWLVDDVALRSDGTIELRCRDLAKMLIDNPITPYSIPRTARAQGRYPLQYIPGQYGYNDYSDIVTELLRWGGWMIGGGGGDYPASEDVFGSIETTGAVSSDELPVPSFDKRPFIDSINAVKEVVGYNFFIRENGAAEFSSGNYWVPGNFDENGNHIDFIPDIDERLQLTQYTATFSDRSLPGIAIVSPGDAYAMIPAPDGSLSLYETWDPYTYALPNNGWSSFHGPITWSDANFTNVTERAALVWLIMMKGVFGTRLGSSTVPFNPAIQLDDQVRIWEESAGEAFIHYVYGKSTNQDLVTGEFNMTLTTHTMESSYTNNWIGDDCCSHTAWLPDASGFYHEPAAFVIDVDESRRASGFPPQQNIFAPFPFRR